MSTGRNDSWVLVGKDGRTHNLPHGMIFIGREECDIILQAASADKRHAVLCYNTSVHEFHIKDLNSLTGTYVNGIRIPEQTYMKLKHLDCIRFGYADVFYLEKTPSPTVCYDDKTLSIKTEKGRKVKFFTSWNSYKEQDANSIIQRRDSEGHDGILTSFTRVDHPPDSLPILPLTNGEVEYDWPANDDNHSDSPDYSQKSETSSSSAPAPFTHAPSDQDASSTHSSPAAMAFTVPFENEVITPRKKLGIRDSISKFAPSKTDAETRAPFQKNSKTEPSPKKMPCTEGKCTLTPKFRTPYGLSSQKDSSNEALKLRDPASFLIKKMLSGGDSVNSQLRLEKANECLEIRQGEVNDDRSEAGTYTVETEHTDCDVEEARKKIDEVFGVIQLSNSVASSYSSNTNSSSIKQIPCLNSRLKQAPLKVPVSTTKQKGVPEPNPQWNKSNKNSARFKRHLPAPPNENTGSSDCTQASNQSLQRIKKPIEQPSTPEKRRPKVATSPKSPGKSKPLSTLKSPGSITNNLSVGSTDKSTSSKEDSSHHKSSDSRSEGSKSPHNSAQLHNVPWNLSGSDLDLDHSKSENNSVLSDTSTEPSSHSSHSGKNKLDQGPQMRLNRAFALRRARLEAESTKRGKENKTITFGQKPMRKTKLSGSTTTLREEGSKLNFHFTPALSKPLVNRSVIKNPNTGIDALKRKTDCKTGHRRIESDPGKGIPVWKTDPKLGSTSDSGRKTLTVALSLDSSNRNLQSFHRSVSCSIVNEVEIPRSNIPCNNIPHRDYPLSLMRNFDHNIMSGSQIVTSQNIDFQSRNHSNKEITALDCLVISAIHQLSSKLWTNAKFLLDKERRKCPKDSDTWLMIDEVLPQAPVSETPEDGDLTKDLSSILKNLKRVEQGLEVLSTVLDSDNEEKRSSVDEKPPLPKNFFIVDM